MARGCEHGTCIGRLVLALICGWSWLTGINLSVLACDLRSLGSERSQLGYETGEESTEDDKGMWTKKGLGERIYLQQAFFKQT